MKHTSSCLALIILSLVGFSAFCQNQPTAIYIVRHAEKVQDGSEDPKLNDLGKNRASKLSDILKKVEISAIYSSPFVRTRKTAQPLAALKEIEIQPYNPSMQQEFMEQVLEKHKGKSILIVGHSNTVPELLNILTKTTQYQQLADDEYDKLFVVSIDSQRGVTVKVEVY